MPASKKRRERTRHRTLWTVEAVRWELRKHEAEYDRLLARKRDKGPGVQLGERIDRAEVPDRPYAVAVPPELTPYIDHWLGTYRPRLQTFARSEVQVGIGGHLWLNRYGRPMRSGAIRTQIECRTEQAFGRHVWPHLFRDCAVTELVDCAPEQIGIAPDLLGHAQFETTKKHYIQASA